MQNNGTFDVEVFDAENFDYDYATDAAVFDETIHFLLQIEEEEFEMLSRQISSRIAMALSY